MKNGRISTMRVHRSMDRIRTILVTGCVVTCVVFVALLSAVVAKAGGTLEVGEEILAILYRTIGRTNRYGKQSRPPLVRRPQRHPAYSASHPSCLGKL
jgi:hypothetical protein